MTGLSRIPRAVHLEAVTHCGGRLFGVFESEAQAIAELSEALKAVSPPLGIRSLRLTSVVPGALNRMEANRELSLSTGTRSDAGAA